MFRLSSVKGIEWIVNTHGRGMHVTETFSIQDHQCNLELYVGYCNNHGCDNYTQLYFKSKEKLKSPIAVTVRATVPRSTLLTKTTESVQNLSHNIWEYGSELSNNHLTFQVIIHAFPSKADKIIQTGSYLNGNASLESFPDDFSKMLETGLNQDAEVKCGEHSLKAHKAVLCARSEVFKAMLQTDMLEGQTGIVRIQDMDACYFRDFMEYMYTGSMPELTFDKTKALYEVGDKYDIKSLMLRCSEYLQDILSRENFFECFVLGDAHSDEELKDKIKTFVLDTKIYLEDEYWVPFYEKFPKVACEIYRLSYKKNQGE